MLLRAGVCYGSAMPNTSDDSSNPGSTSDAGGPQHDEPALPPKAIVDDLLAVSNRLQTSVKKSQSE